MPIGKSSFDQPQGIDAAGCPVKLNGKLKGIHPVGETFLPFIFGGNINPNSKAGTAVVGVISIS